jgi:dihydroorotase
VSRLLIRGGHVVDPAQGIDEPRDLLIVDDRIEALDAPGSLNLDAGDPNSREIDAGGLYVMPGLIDMQVHLREPGGEKAETITSGATAAVAGGFTTIIATPDTDPPVDNEASAEFVIIGGERAGGAHVLPMGALTKRCEGAELADIGVLFNTGAVAFTDGDRAIPSASLMGKLLKYVSMFGVPVVQIPLEPSLGNGIVHGGEKSLKLGMAGISATAEEVLMSRDVLLARDAGAHIHFSPISTKGAVRIVREARAQKIHVTAGTTPHHLLLTDDVIEQYDPSAHKVLPPLRSADHVEALVEAVAAGDVDVITSDHAPVAAEDKALEFEFAPFGVVGLETTFAALYTKLVLPGRLTLSRLVECLSTGPARVLGLDSKGTLAPESTADVTLIDPKPAWKVDPARFLSRSSNTPFPNWELMSRPRWVVVGGRLIDVAALHAEAHAEAMARRL